jgi:hypothetical protein
MGVGRAGFYGYDWLENLGPAGLLDEIVNADRIDPEWQHLQVGDHVYPAPEAASWTVAELVPERLLVLADPGQWSWALMLSPLDGDRTRLTTRMRWGLAHGAGPTALAAGARRRSDRAGGVLRRR